MANLDYVSEEEYGRIIEVYMRHVVIEEMDELLVAERRALLVDQYLPFVEYMAKNPDPDRDRAARNFFRDLRNIAREAAQEAATETAPEAAARDHSPPQRNDPPRANWAIVFKRKMVDIFKAYWTRVSRRRG